MKQTTGICTKCGIRVYLLADGKTEKHGSWDGCTGSLIPPKKGTAR